MRFKVLFDDNGRIDNVSQTGVYDSFLPGHSNVIIVTDARNTDDAKQQASRIWREQHGAPKEDNGYRKPLEDKDKPFEYTDEYEPYEFPPGYSYIGEKIDKALAILNRPENVEECFMKAPESWPEPPEQEEILMQFKPMNGRVLVKRDDAEETTPGGLFLPPTGREVPYVGKIISVADLSNSVVSPGQKILFGKYAGTDIKIDNEDYVLIKEDDILGRFE